MASRVMVHGTGLLVASYLNQYHSRALRDLHSPVTSIILLALSKGTSRWAEKGNGVSERGLP